MQTKELKKVKRIFSEEFKRKKVKEIEEKLTTVLEISREYKVSCTSVYKWLYKYSLNFKKELTQVVQMESEQEKTRKLKAQIAELERALGRKQMELDFANKMLEIASEEVGEDLKKKYGTPPLNGSESTGNSTATP